MVLAREWSDGETVTEYCPVCEEQTEQTVHKSDDDNAWTKCNRCGELPVHST